ncbi:MAG TPA: GGDEF domain-containing protein [Thermoanaerobaculia bacterium]|nr:GGDEF domain-containing protein [Thermoanaerobaculia bacterium]
MRPVWIAVPAILVIGWVDYLTGPEIGFSLLYLLPIAISAWKGDAIDSAAAAVTAAGCWIVADAAAQPAMAVTLWNGFTRFVIFGAAAFLVHQVRIDRNELHAMNARLQAALRSEAELARTDPLTGLANSRAFLEQLERELARAGRDERSITLLYIDLDGFKSVNDQYGHQTGDEVLSRIAEALRASVRTGDVIARMGGDEFAALLWGAGAGPATDVAARIAESVQGVAASYPAATLGVSIGVAQPRGADVTAEQLLREADDAMYDQKRRDVTPAGE